MVSSAVNPTVCIDMTVQLCASQVASTLNKLCPPPKKKNFCPNGKAQCCRQINVFIIFVIFREIANLNDNFSLKCPLLQFSPVLLKL